MLYRILVEGLWPDVPALYFVSSQSMCLDLVCRHCALPNLSPSALAWCAGTELCFYSVLAKVPWHDVPALYFVSTAS